MKDFMGRPLELGDDIAFTWDGSMLMFGVVAKPGAGANKYKARPESGYIFVDNLKGKRTWRYHTQVSKLG